MNLREGIIATAQALGMHPADLATIISYETGGTFDPLQRGPTTQWGTHEGLIQFGDPQGERYGADFSSAEAALASQLGPNGAIARYFRDNGWRPGMGLLDAYSIVNAGAPGRYDASDAGNGGAPGTVADKVREQMGGHRRNAIELLGFGGDVPAMAEPYAPDPRIADAFAAPTSPAAAPTAGNALLDMLTPMGASAPVPAPPMLGSEPQGNALAALGQPSAGNAMGAAYGGGPMDEPAPVLPAVAMPALRPRTDATVAQILAAFGRAPATYQEPTWRLWTPE